MERSGTGTEDEQVHAETLPVEVRESSTADIQDDPVRAYLLLLGDLLIIGVAGILLYWGVWLHFMQIHSIETTRYRCYAVAFWHGTAHLETFIRGCGFLLHNSGPIPVGPGTPAILTWLIAQQSPLQPFHALPMEYPLLTLIPFTLIMLAPAQWYLIAFGILMTFVAGCIYFMLKRSRSTGSAIAFAAYLVIGCWASALARFDLLPAALTLGGALLMQRGRWNWAFGLLALAFLLKFYPLVLIPVFFIAQQKQFAASKWYAWQRWSGLALFAIICVVVMSVSLLLSVEGTVSSLAYFEDRPIQVETLGAVFLWFGSHVGYPLKYVFTFGSGNVLSALSTPVSLLLSASFGLGLLYLYWRQWRGKMDIFTACLIALLIAIITGKVFSPQYLIWVTAFVAYVGRTNWKWLLSWGIVGVLTTLIYPFLYSYPFANSYPAFYTTDANNPGIVSVGQIVVFYPFVLLRALIIIGMIGVLLYQSYPRRSVAQGSISHEIA
ncbi:MAG: hypothetical protein H0W02_00720 [Ktedonobacteraceae bacterium]|nr:hypothetical protein [Ktedonobacteraceae bacterium]